MALLIRRRGLMDTNGSSPLPAGYQAIRYIQTVGTASFIDTGIAGNDNSIEIDFVLEPLEKGNYSGGIIGNHDGEDKKCWRCIQGATANVKLLVFTLNNRQARASTGITITPIDTIVGKRLGIHMEYGSAYVEYDGNRYTGSATTDTAETSDKNIFIGRNGPTSTQNTSSPSYRFYDYVKIHQQGELVRDYRPCIRKSDNCVGLYDLVTENFKASEGNSQFVYNN